MKQKFLLCLLSLCVILVIYEVADWKNAARMVERERVTLHFSENDDLTEADYRLILSQTGLGKPAVERLKKTGENFPKELEKFQEQYLKPLKYRRGFIFFPTTTAEVLVDEAGHRRNLKLPPVEKGDIFITKSTKTMLYRHGHAAICLDAETGRVAEAMTLGSPSGISSLDSLCSYPTLLILRPQADEETISAAIDYTSEKLLGIPYSPVAGFFRKDKKGMQTIDATYCSHLVWQAYKAAGIDLDSDGGWLVSPYDISRSGELEVVFAFGFGEKNGW